MDIVDRLRDMQAKKYRSDWANWVQTQCGEAASEIEQLRLIVQRLQFSLADTEALEIGTASALALKQSEVESLRQQLAEAQQEIADWKADCETGHDQDEATIAELRQRSGAVFPSAQNNTCTNLI